MASESTGLLGSNQKPLPPFHLHVEMFRCIGLSVGLLMVAVGWVVTKLFVWGNFDNPDRAQDTYIWKVFDFPHTCVFIDFNPAKSVAALMMNFVTLPLIVFTLLNHWRLRVAHSKGEITDGLLKFSECTYIFRIFCFVYFFMCLVNSPDLPYDGPYDTWEKMSGSRAWRHYLYHYLPFMFWQLALALQAWEQSHFHYETGSIPQLPCFPTITKNGVWWYTRLIIVVFIYYTGYIWAHMFYFPWPLKNWTLFAQFIMFFYLFLTTAFPALMAWCHWQGKGGVTPTRNTIEFF
mmetsp:Transcript_40314/g.45429  ORF Transcript_40314/g.45429 Transcript_40314/m.45429 type:complete len:291 (-) Transcript_40314:264-1136(-)